MQHARLLAEEVPSGIVSCGCLGDLSIGTWFDSVNEVWKEDRILDEEDGNVIANNVWSLTISNEQRHLSL